MSGGVRNISGSKERREVWPKENRKRGQCRENSTNFCGQAAAINSPGLVITLVRHISGLGGARGVRAPLCSICYVLAAGGGWVLGVRGCWGVLGFRKTDDQ